MSDSPNPAGTPDHTDESAFGLGGQTSQQADENAAFDEDSPAEDDALGTAAGGADEEVPDSQSADVAAGYDDPSDAPHTDDTFPSVADDGTPRD